MGKAPAFQLYVSDIEQDTGSLSLAACGAWNRALWAMWRSPVRGEITHNLDGFARVLRCSEIEAESALLELIREGICDATVEGVNVTRDAEVTLRSKKVTVRNRRMFREAREAELHAKRQLKYRERLKNGGSAGDSDAEVTDPSSVFLSSSSESRTQLPSPSPNLKSTNSGGGSRAETARSRRPQICDDEFLTQLQAKPAYHDLNVALIYGKLVAWCEVKGKQPTRSRLVNWLNREERPMTASVPNGAKFNGKSAYETASERNARNVREGLARFGIGVTPEDPGPDRDQVTPGLLAPGSRSR